MTKDANSKIMKATGLIVLEIRNSNPNGDPERDGAPRRRRGDIGEISPVSVKRKMRDLVGNKRGPIWLYLKQRYNLDEQAFNILEERDQERSVVKKMILNDKNKPLEEKEFVKKYWDARVFGNTFLEEAEGASASDADTKDAAKAKKTKADDALTLKKNVKTGVLHFGLGLSIAPVTSRTDFTLTNKKGVEEDKTGGMAPGAFKFIEHGIYVIPFFVNPSQASHTGCTKQDIDIALDLIPYVYSHNPSLVRTQVEVLHAWYVEHKNDRGSCSDFALIDALTPAKKESKGTPSNSQSEYDIPGIEALRPFENRVTARDLMDLLGQ